MRNIIIFLLLIMFVFIISCKSKEESNVAPATKPEPKQIVSAQHINTNDNKVDKSQSPTVKRKYMFPSMMNKNDMYYCERENDYTCTPLLRSLVANTWKLSGDKYGRNFIYTSPEISYSELQEYLHFNDCDVTYIDNLKPGEPQALIQTEWLTCKITFLDKIYDGKNRSVRLKAVLINNEVQANANKEAEYDKNKGFIRKILDVFEVVHQ